MTLEDLATRSGVSRAMLSKVERGEKNPTIGIAKRIAHALDTTLSFLTGGLEDRQAVVVVRHNQRHVFRDSETGFERHLLAPRWPVAGSNCCNTCSGRGLHGDDACVSKWNGEAYCGDRR